MEVATGLEPVKTGFADQRLDRFGIATKMKGARLHAQFPHIVDELWGKVLVTRHLATGLHRDLSPCADVRDISDGPSRPAF